jgi:hypothetical protein
LKILYELMELGRLGKLKFIRKLINFSFLLLFYNKRIIRLNKDSLKNLNGVYYHKGSQTMDLLGLNESETAIWLKEPHS